MSYVLKIMELAGFPISERFALVKPIEALGDAWVKSYDPEGRDGWGDLVLTWARSEALRFEDQAAAHALWTAIPSNRPTRPDGKPNRPLTTMTVMIEPVDE